MSICEQENKQISYSTKLDYIFSGANEAQKDKVFITFRMMQG